jgi:tRNA pseudouridine32 synthase/23S rRNA pseudouridine746 synthase
VFHDLFFIVCGMWISKRAHRIFGSVYESSSSVATILFENDAYLSVDKPAGISCIPERNRSVPSLLKSIEQERGTRLFVVHRLDKEASGVLVFAKTPDAHHVLNDLFAQRKVTKTYLLLVHGVIGEDTGIIEDPIREFGSGRMGVDAIQGKASRTEFRTVRRMELATLVEAHPLTGRRHQLRVHFYARGNPVVGDLRYGDRMLQHRYERLMLHASSIAFQVPGGRFIHIVAPVPASYQRILESWGTGRFSTLA